MTALMNGICQCTPIPFLQNVFLVDEFAAISWQQINLLLQLPDKWLMCALQCARFFNFTQTRSRQSIHACSLPDPLRPLGETGLFECCGYVQDDAASLLVTVWQNFALFSTANLHDGEDEVAFPAQHQCPLACQSPWQSPSSS